MKLEIRERVLEEQAAAERREEPLVIEGQVEEIGETDYGYRLMVSDCEEYGPEARRIPRRMYCYTDRADGLKIGMRIRAEGTMEAPEPERNPGGFDHRSFCPGEGDRRDLPGRPDSAGWPWIQPVPGGDPSDTALAGRTSGPAGLRYRWRDPEGSALRKPVGYGPGDLRVIPEKRDLSCAGHQRSPCVHPWTWTMEGLKKVRLWVCGGRRGSGSLSVLLWAHDRLRAVGGAGCGHVRALLSCSLSGPDL